VLEVGVNDSSDSWHGRSDVAPSGDYQMMNPEKVSPRGSGVARSREPDDVRGP
jgi:hypothetical protein